MMIPFTNWLPDVLPEAPNCPRVTAINAIRQAVITFCQHSRFWRHDMDPMTTVAGVRLYELDTPVQTRVVAVRALQLDSQPLTEFNVDALDKEDAGWRSRQGLPARYSFQDPMTVLLDTIPLAAGVLSATLALKPEQSAAGCDDILYEEYRDAIAAGALARLLMMPGKPWTDPNVASLKQTVFMSHADAAKVRADQAFASRARRRVRPHYL